MMRSWSSKIFATFVISSATTTTPAAWFASSRQLLHTVVLPNRDSKSDIHLPTIDKTEMFMGLGKHALR